MNTALKGMLFLVALGFGGAQATQDIAKKVQGDWLVTSSGDLLTPVLQIRKHTENGPGRSEFYGHWS